MVHINSLLDLKMFLSALTADQLKQTFRIVTDGIAQDCEKAEILKDPVFVSIADEDDRGTLAELMKIHGDEFNIKDYYESNLQGTIYFDLD